MIKEATRVRALREAKGLLQSFGFNGFSFQHIADLLGIKKPSLFDHFKSKEDLGKALVEDYVANFKNWAETVEPFPPREKIGAIFELFYRISQDKNKLCLAAALTADFNSIPKSMQKAVRGMVDIRSEWITDVIREGQKIKIFRTDMHAEDLKNLVVTSSWGSQMLSRIHSNPEKIRQMKEIVLKLLDA